MLAVKLDHKFYTQFMFHILFKNIYFRFPTGTLVLELDFFEKLV